MKIERILNVGYSFGAAIVLAGAYAKIQHTSYASLLLGIGFGIEVLIFCSYGFMEMFEKPQKQELGNSTKQDNSQLNSTLLELDSTVKRAFNLK